MCVRVGGHATRLAGVVRTAAFRNATATSSNENLARGSFQRKGRFVLCTIVSQCVLIDTSSSPLSTSINASQ